MSPSVVIAFLTIFFLGPIPVWHLLLHAFLPAWRKHPQAYYLLGAGVWALLLPLSWFLAQTSPLLFEPSRWARGIGLGASGAAFLVALWSMMTLTPRRFFVWAVLRPETLPPERVLRGPYRFTAHPTYLAIVVATAATFLASGAAILLGAVAAIGVLLAIVAILEQRELNQRLTASLPELQPAPPPLTPSPRN